MRDRTRKERERRARKDGKTEGRGRRFRALVDRVQFLEQEQIRVMGRYKLAYRASHIILRTLAAPESTTEVPRGARRMLRWMEEDAGKNDWDMSLPQEEGGSSDEEEHPERGVKRRRLMRRASPEVEEREVEPCRVGGLRGGTGSSGCAPSPFRILAGGFPVHGRRGG